MARLRPELQGEDWLIAPNPDRIDGLEGVRTLDPFKGQEVVDHHVWRDGTGEWRCWACIRGTSVGRIFYGWVSSSLESSEWRATGVEMRRSQECGESVNDRTGGASSQPNCFPGMSTAKNEWLQSPFVTYHDGTYYMYYGGGDADPSGSLYASSICLATSSDGVRFTRYQNECGYSRLFVGPGEARDPCVLRNGEEWILYYSGAETGTNAPNKVYVRTSRDLVHWSGSREVHWGGSAGANAYECECPFVIEKEGYFYLFRTRNYATGLTYVYRSPDPFDFGIDSDEHLVCTIEVAAPEIITEKGIDYITSVQDLFGGIRLQRLSWVPD